jgi:hypothetical protein
MFAASGYAVQPDGSVSDALIDAIVATGDEAAVVARLDELLAAGLDELLLTAAPMGHVADERTRLVEFVGRL